MPALARKENVEQSTSIAFLPDGVATYNDEISAFHPFDAGIEGAVQGKELFALLNKIKDEEIELLIEGNQLIAYYGKKSQAGIKLEAEVHLPLNEMGMPENWEPLPTEACKAMEFCMFSTSSEKNKPLLQCIHMVDDIAEATDNFRIMRYFLPEKEFFPFALLLHAAYVRVLLDYNPVEAALTDGWAHFRNADGTIFSCRVMNAADYPNLDRFLEAADGGEKILLPKDLGASLDRAGVFSGNKECGRDTNERIQVTLDKGELVVRGEGAGGWIEEVSDVEYKGAALAFDVNPAFLKDMLSKTDKVQIAKNLLKFSADEFVHVISTLAPKKK